MSDYHVPEVLLYLRKRRRESPQPIAVADLPPSRLYQMCAAETESGPVLKMLYGHAFVEAGWILDKEGGAPFPVCPICGYVF